METNGPNAAEVAWWNSEPGMRWARLHERIALTFAPFAPAGLAAARPQPGERVLDVGCGCGDSVLDLTSAVGPSGSVIGIDISKPMLGLAEQRASALGLTNARFVLADASAHDFQPEFDLVYSRFGVMFFDDPVGAFTNIRRALKPDGRVTFLCWRTLAENPWFTVPYDAVKPLVPAPAAAEGAPGPLAFADPSRVQAILGDAGFRDVRTDAFDALLPLGSRSVAAHLVSQLGPTTRLLHGVEGTAHERAMLALDEALQVHEVDGEIRLGGAVWIVSART